MAKEAFKHKTKVEEEVQQGQMPFGFGTGDEELGPGEWWHETTDPKTGAVTKVKNGIQAMHGIHSGVPSIGLKTVAQARAELQSEWNIDPAAVAVIAGNVVDEDTILGKDCELLAFVKKAAVKGSAVAEKRFTGRVRQSGRRRAIGKNKPSLRLQARINSWNETQKNIHKLEVPPTAFKCPGSNKK